MEDKVKILRLVEDGHFVFIVRDQNEISKNKISKHKIVTLKSGNFEVTCSHKDLCEDVIREEIRQRIRKIKMD